MTAAEKHYQKMTETPVSRLIITLGIPTTISMLITGIYNLADSYFVGLGPTGESQQAATGILFTLQSIIQAFAFMWGHGSGTFVSKSLADKDTETASRYVSSAFFAGGAVGVLILMLGLCFLEPFMRFLGSTETALPYAMKYGFWVLLSCPIMIASIVLNNNLRYEGKAFYSMIGLCSGGLLNILGDWFFICVLGMDIFGAGMATALSQLVSFLLLLFFYRRMAQSKISIRAVSRDVKEYIGIIKVGFPSLIRQGLNSISGGVLNTLMRPYGDVMVAGMSVANRFSSLIMFVGLGIGQGFQPVAAFNYQAKKYSRVKRGLLFTTAFGACLVTLLALIGGIFAEPVVRFLQQGATDTTVGITALRYAMVGVLFLPLSVPVNMLFQSIRRAGIASFLSVMRSGALFIPTIFIAHALLQQTGIMIAQPVADILTGLVSIPFIVYFMKSTPKDS